jgi:hypothetical protein
LTIGIAVIFKGFTRLTSLFIKDDHVVGGPTKEKGIIAFFSLLEGGWWKYVIVGVFLFLAYNSIKTGVIKYKSKK